MWRFVSEYLTMTVIDDDCIVKMCGKDRIEQAHKGAKKESDCPAIKEAWLYETKCERTKARGQDKGSDFACW